MEQLFDFAEAKARKESAHDVFEITRTDFLVNARATARRHALNHGTVTIDDVRRFTPLPDGMSPNVFGAVFRGNEWECVGFEASTRVLARARTIRRYRLTQVAAARERSFRLAGITA